MRVNVATDYGAPGNGSSWAYAQIRNAYQAVKAAGGGEVFVPIGTYLMDQQLVIDSPHVTFKGEGWGSVLKAASGQRLHGLFRLEASASDISFENLKLDGNREGAGLETVITSYMPQTIESLASWVRVQHCEFTGSPRFGFGFGSGSEHLRFDDCWFHDNGSLLADGSTPGSSFSAAGGGGGILGGDFAHTAMPYDVRIEDNVFENNRRADAGNQHEGSAAFVGCKELLFARNRCLDNWNSGGQLVDLNSDGGVDCDWKILDNRFIVTSSLEPAGAFTWGLELNNRGYTIRGNTFVGGRGPGVAISALSPDRESGHAIIHGNTFEAKEQGVWLRTGPSCRLAAVQVVNNRYRAMDPAGHGVQLDAGVVASAALDNDFSQAGYPPTFDVLDQTGSQMVRRL